MTMMPGFSNENVKRELAAVLRDFVGHGRHMSFADLARSTGDEERKLRSYVEADGPMMPADQMIRIMAALPPEAFGRLCLFLGFAAPAPLDHSADATFRRAMTLASRIVAAGNEAMEDGALSPVEKANLADMMADALPVFSGVACGDAPS